MPLPEGVFRIKKPSGKVYFYHQTGRHLEKALRGTLTRIPYEPREAEFWSFCASLSGKSAAPKKGTFKAIIELYKASSKWAGFSPKTQDVYDYYLGLIEKAWGNQIADDLTQAAISAARDALAATAPVSANLLVRVLRAMCAWAIGDGHMTRNPARDVPQVETQVETTEPWPEAVWAAVVRHGPADLSRLAYLGRATGQRVGDLVKFWPAMRRGDGLDIKISKLRGKKHFLPLSPAHLKEIDGWNVGEMTPYLTKPDGKRHTEASIRYRLRTWLGESAPESIRGADVSPHGLRALACCDARLAGRTHQEIAALFGMSIQMVERYTRHIDQEALARKARSGMD